MTKRILAAVDVGSNTFRMLIAEVSTGVVKELHSERMITRLGSGTAERHAVSSEAVERGIRALRKFSRDLRRFPVEEVCAVGTSALREAENSHLFVRRARDEAGLDVKIISGFEEAALTTLGISMGVPSAENMLLIDIGGGSTEVIVVQEGKKRSSQSAELGVVSLADRFMRHDPPHESEMSGMESETREKVSALRKESGTIPPDVVPIGTGGTVTTLSAMTQGLHAFDRERVHNSRLSRTTVREVFSRIAAMPSQERAARYPLLEYGRADIIVPGVLILHTLMMTFGFREVIVSDSGLLEGVLLQLYRDREKDAREKRREEP